MIRPAFYAFISLIFLPLNFSLMAQDKEIEKPLTIVGLGDSTTAGTPGFLSPREAPPEGSGNVQSQYAYWLEQSHPGWKVLNRGVRGQRSDQILKRFEYDVLKNDPDIVIILAGVNDLYQGYPVSHVITHLGKLYDAAAANGIVVAACTVLPFDLAAPEVTSNILKVNRWIESNAEEKGFIFCDTYNAVSDKKNPGRFTDSPDGVHPGVEGYRSMAQEIGKVIESYLGKEGAGRNG